jgi:hypothetical protein
MSKEKIHVARKVIRSLYVASQWSLKRRRYPAIRLADVTPVPEEPSGPRTLTTQWIVIRGEPVIAPDACLLEDSDGPRFPTPEQLTFLDTIQALALRGGADEEITQILREDPSIAALVPFLASTLLNAGTRLTTRKEHPAQRTRIARLAGCGWLANPHIREEVMPYLPRIIKALHQLGAMASTVSDTREILGYANAIWENDHKMEVQFVDKSAIRVICDGKECEACAREIICQVHLPKFFYLSHPAFHAMVLKSRGQERLLNVVYSVIALRIYPYRNDRKTCVEMIQELWVGDDVKAATKVYEQMQGVW